MTIYDSPFTALLTLLVLLLPACAAEKEPLPKPPEANPPPALDLSQPRTFVYDCGEDGYRFVARLEGEMAWLFLPGRTVSLPHVRSVSGAKYDSGEILFWTRGREASLSVRGEPRRRCVNDARAAVWEHAKLSGVEFRARGNEPGWHLEITSEREILLVTDYGASRYTFRSPQREIDSASRRTFYRAQADGHSLIVILEGLPCQDTMSDESYETTVTVRLDGRELHGCGRAFYSSGPGSTGSRTDPRPSSPFRPPQ